MNTCVCVCTCIIVDIIIITNSLLFHFTVDTRLCITYSKNNKECCAIDCKESRWSPVCDCRYCKKHRGPNNLMRQVQDSGFSRW